MKSAGDILAFRIAQQRALALLPAEIAAPLWNKTNELMAELEELRTGARKETIERALRLAAIERALPNQPADERLAALKERGFPRACVFRLRKLARSLTKDETASSVST